MEKRLYLVPVGLALVLCVIAYFALKNGAQFVSAPAAVAPVASPPPVPAIPEKPATVAVLVTSRPSGANIWINAKDTGLLTPSKVDLPAEGKFYLMVRKRGYLPFIHDHVLQEMKGMKFEAKLEHPVHHRRK
jgi:hypothetical protein